jgi:hypothetical protein
MENSKISKFLSPYYTKYNIITVLIISIYIFFKFALLNISPLLSGDSSGYIQASVLPITDSHFYEYKGLSYIFILKLFSDNLYLVEFLQILVSIIAWVVLAFIISKYFKSHIVKIWVFLLLFSLSLTSNVIQYDVIVLTESLTISLFVLLIALNLEYFYGKNGKLLNDVLLFFIIILSLTFLFLRDIHSYLILFIGGLGIVYLIVNYKNIKKIDKKIGIATLILTSMSFIQLKLVDTSYRYVVTTANQMAVNIIPNPEYRSYFVTKFNMPFDNNILKLSNKLYWDWDMTNSSIKLYDTWLHTNGKTAYMHFLFEHIGFFTVKYLKDIGNLFNGFWIDPQAISSTSIYSCFNDAIYNQIFIHAVFLGATLYILLLFYNNLHNYRAIVALLTVLIIIAMIHGFFAYYGDATEIARHILLSTVSFKISFFIVIFLIFDIFIVNLSPSISKLKIDSVKILN